MQLVTSVSLVLSLLFTNLSSFSGRGNACQQFGQLAKANNVIFLNTEVGEENLENIKNKIFESRNCLLGGI